MKKSKFLVAPMNLHLFDGAGTAGDGGASPGSSGETGTSGTIATKADNTQSANGRGTEKAADLIKQDATASRQDIVVASPDDERRVNFNNYIRGEGKQYYDENVQKIINKRFAETRVLEDNAKTIEPMLRALATNYNVDSTDLKALSEAVLNDQRLYEERAKQNGVSVETQMKFDKIQQQNDLLLAQQQEQAKLEHTQQIINSWNEQAEEFKQEVPDFDLDSALENKEFYDLVTRGFKISTAYNAAFPDLFEKRVAVKTEKRVTDNIRSRGMRVSENGVSSTATVTERFDVKNLTPAQRREMANRAERGEIITFR